MKKKMVRQLIAGTLGLAMLLGDVCGSGGLTVYAEEAAEDEDSDEYDESSEDEEIYSYEDDDDWTDEDEYAEDYSVEDDYDDSYEDEGNCDDDVEYADSGLDTGSYDGYIDVEPGGSVTLETNVIVNDGVSVTYQWYCDYEELEGETGATLTVENITEYTYYECKVTDAYGNSIWFYYNVYCDNELDVGYSKTSLYVLSGGDAEFTVSATVKKGSIYYEWSVYDKEEYTYETVKEESGAGSVLTVENICEDVRYRCIVSDDYGNSEYVYFSVKVTETLQLNTNRTAYEFYVNEDESITLSVEPVTANTDSLEYQWYSGEFEYNTYYFSTVEFTAIDGATDKEYVVSEEDLTSSSTYFKCVVFDGECTRTQTFYVYTVTGLTTTQEQMYYFTEPGTEVELSVSATTDVDADLTYTWYLYTYSEDAGSVYTPITQGVTTSGDTSVLTLTANKTAEYSCTVSDGYTSSTRYFFVEIENGLNAEMGLDEYEQYIEPGETITLSVIASADSGSISYQWYSSDAGLISGATGSTLTVGTADYYYCVVSDCYDNSTDVSVVYNSLCKVR